MKARNCSQLVTVKFSRFSLQPLTRRVASCGSSLFSYIFSEASHYLVSSSFYFTAPNEFIMRHIMAIILGGETGGGRG